MNDIYKLLAETLPTDTGYTLAIEHGAEPAPYQQIIAQTGASHWCRTAGLTDIATPWPKQGNFYETILLPIPKGKAALDFVLAATTSVIAPQGTVYLFGSNDDGIKSADKNAQNYFQKVDVAANGGKGRIYTLRSPTKQKSVDNFKQIHELIINGQTIPFITYPGLFAKGQLDAATELLIEHMPNIEASSKVLDFACGIGPLAKAAAIKQPDCIITIADYDALAVHAAAQNLPDAVAICTDDPAELKGSYDLILSNPPIHSGQKLSYDVVEKLIARLPQLLNPNGSAYLVTQVTVPVARMAADKKMASSEIAASRSFRVTKITV